LGRPRCNPTVAFGQTLLSDSTSSVTKLVKWVTVSVCGLRFWSVTLTNLVGDGIKILVGDSVAINYQKEIDDIGATHIVDIPHLRTELDALRRLPVSAS